MLLIAFGWSGWGGGRWGGGDERVDVDSCVGWVVYNYITFKRVYFRVVKGV